MKIRTCTVFLERFEEHTQYALLKQCLFIVHRKIGCIFVLFLITIEMNFRYRFQVSSSFRRMLAHVIVLTILLVLMQLHVSPLVTDLSSSLALQIFFSETAEPASATMYNLLCA